MFLRIYSSPPLFVTFRGERWSIAVSNDAVRQIVAYGSEPGTAVVLRTFEENSDVAAAWRDGFPVENSEEAREFAEFLVGEGLAEMISPERRSAALPPRRHVEQDSEFGLPQ